MPGPVHYLPILTTLVAAGFAVVVLGRWRERGGTHLLWWGIGMVTYGLGTLTESLTTLLGGWPLATGTVYLMLKRRTAHWLTGITLGFIVVAAACVLAAPVDAALVESHRLSGRVFGWQWVRAFSPFINLYAAAFLIGGAALSAARYRRVEGGGRRAWGNALIAVGALLPGIGGSFTRFGHVEVLYVTELAGLLLIYAGYRLNVTAGAPTIHRVQQAVATG